MISFVLFMACEGEPPQGWVASEKTGGPTVVYDVLAEPLAELLAAELLAAEALGRSERGEVTRS